MEPQHWIGLGALVFTVGANLVLITVFMQNIRGDIAVLNTRLDAFDFDMQSIANYGSRLAVAEERNKHNAALIINMQAEHLRMWATIDDLRRGRGLIQQ